MGEGGVEAEGGEAVFGGDGDGAVVEEGVGEGGDGEEEGFGVGAGREGGDLRGERAERGGAVEVGAGGAVDEEGAGGAVEGEGPEVVFERDQGGGGEGGEEVVRGEAGVGEAEGGGGGDGGVVEHGGGIDQKVTQASL